MLDVITCVRSKDPEIVLFQRIIDACQQFYRMVGWIDRDIDRFLEDMLEDTPLWKCARCKHIDFNYSLGEAPLCRYCYRDKCLDEIDEYGPELKPCNEEGKD